MFQMLNLMVQNGLKRLGSDQRGVTAVEYTVLVALVIVVIIGATTGIGNLIGTIWGNVMTALGG